MTLSRVSLTSDHRSTMNPFWKILLLSTAIGWLSHVTWAKCEADNVDTFVLATDVDLRTEPYAIFFGKDLEACVAECRLQDECRSATMQRDERGTKCSLYNDTAEELRERKEDPKTAIYYLEKRCLKGACNQLFSLEVIANSTLEGYTDHVFSNVSQSGCLEACFSWTPFPCRSVEYDLTAATCHLSRHDRYDRSTSFKQTAKSVLYFDNNCASQHKGFEGSMAEIILLGNAQHPYVASEVDGTTVGECGQLCLRSTTFPCRSFIYGKRRGTHYCGLSHQNRIGLLGHVNSFTPSDAINYYEIAKDRDVCDFQDVHFELTSGALLLDRPVKSKVTTTQKACLEECRGDARCKAVSIDHRNGLCTFHEVAAADKLRLNNTWNVFEKICVPARRTCSKQWAFERVRGRNLVAPSLRKAVPAFTKEECLAACLELKDFECKSVQYDSKLSECHLNGYNRFSMSEKQLKFHRASLDLDYYENNCMAEPRGFCNTKVHRRTAIGNSDEILTTRDVSGCRQACFNSHDFNCRTYTYNLDTGLCSLSHHTITTVPYSLITSEANSETHEVISCYNVSVTCEPQEMRVNVKTSAIFDGKIYVRNKVNTCYADISRNNTFTFPIALYGPECGTRSESEGKFSNVIVIQNNDLVLTSLDKAVGVHCTYELGNKTEFAVLTIKNMSASEMSRGRARPPQLTMRILDLKGNDKTSVKLGEPLRVQVAMEAKSAYGIFVRNMVATDASGVSNLTLIDSKGCPAEGKMIREMRQIDGQNRALESVMEAFTFTGSNVLRIETDVETCLDSCNPVMCHVPSGRSDDEYTSVESLGRRRRRATASVQVFKLTKTVAVHSDKFGVGGDAMQRRLQSSEEDDDYEFVQNGANSSDNNICLDSLVLTIGGSIFILLQIILVTACFATKYYQKQRRLTQQRRQTPLFAPSLRLGPVLP